jgi:NAD(P)-dependent dehydrogenase (short-subunit alcohol dehydrogenase family)
VDRSVVLITGATGGLGRIAAAAFAADGARLGLGGRDADRIATLAADLRLADDAWAPGVGDLSTAGGADAAIRDVIARLGRVDVLVHVVGGASWGTALVDLEPEVLTTMLAQHVWSTFHVARAVIPGMTERGWGRIIAVTSTTTTKPGAGAAAYTAAKAGQEALIRSIAREVADKGITANVLAVGKIDIAHERDAAPSPKNAGWATPEEVVATMRFLCSEAASAVNGARIALDPRG